MTAPRPVTITAGVACLAVSLLIGVAILYFAWGEPKIALFCLLFIGSLTGWALRSGWPRWVIAFMAVVSVALTYQQVSFQFTYGTLVPIATGVQFALELLGFVLLFHPTSHRWYYRPRSVT